MNKTNVKEMLRDRDLKNGMLNIIISTVGIWRNHSTQGKIETDINKGIESAINNYLMDYFNNFQVYFITNNFKSGKNFLDNFYSANPEINTTVNEILDNGITPIKLILGGKKADKPLYYYNDNLNKGLKALLNLKNN